MKNVSALIAFFLILCVIGKVDAQMKDYVVLKSGDTVKGDFKKTTKKFRAEGTERYKILDSKKVATFYRSKDTVSYVSAVLPSYLKPIFLKKILNGRVQLLEDYAVSPPVMNSPGKTIITWYIVKDGGELFQVKTNNLFGSRDKRKGNLENLLGDNVPLWNDFLAEKKFTYELIQAYIKRYNDEYTRLTAK